VAMGRPMLPTQGTPNTRINDDRWLVFTGLEM
jgi:hypothetical protein